ncbi:MAG: glycoside hydrolase family 9 protein, partial [Deltaproteobacteria bacterium]|nr:glycoside hydrolase family 9 protein [Deltaproteobacteria bacterium]
MLHHSRNCLHLGLVAAALAVPLGCNSHLLVPSGDPEVVIVNPPPLPPGAEPGLSDAGLPPVSGTDATLAPLPDGAMPDAALGPDGGQDSPVASPDFGADMAASPDLGRDAGADLGPDARVVPDTNCPTPVPPLTFPGTPTCQGTEGGLGEAFQKALWFLHVNKSGPGVANTYVQWRGDAHVMDQHIRLDSAAATGVDMSQAFIARNKAILDPKNTGEVDLSGGFHDAGDFIKFGLTTGFLASTLAWSMYEFPEAYRAAGLEDEAFNLVRWADDYFLRCTFLDSGGNLVAFAQQVGDQTDHTCGWMPP